jgi:hypothetical protein
VDVDLLSRLDQRVGPDEQAGVVQIEDETLVSVVLVKELAGDPALHASVVSLLHGSITAGGEIQLRQSCVIDVHPSGVKTLELKIDSSGIATGAGSLE